MDPASLLQPVSILIEGLVCMLGIALAVQKMKFYGWFIAFTFGVYVMYDFLVLTEARIAPRVSCPAVSGGKHLNPVCRLANLPERLGEGP